MTITDVSPPALQDVALLPAQRNYLRGLRATIEHIPQLPIFVPFDAREKVDIAALTSALAFLAARHEALHAILHFDGAAWVQQVGIVVTAPTVVLRRVEDDAGAYDAIFAVAFAPWDLSDPLKLRCVVTELPSGSQRVCVILHHVVCDASSSYVFRLELQEVYDALVEGRQAHLRPVSTSFSTWSTVNAAAEATECDAPALLQHFEQLVSRGMARSDAGKFIAARSVEVRNANYRHWLPSVVDDCSSVLREGLNLEDFRITRHGRDSSKLVSTIGPLGVADLLVLAHDGTSSPVPRRFSMTQVQRALETQSPEACAIIRSRTALINPVFGLAGSHRNTRLRWSTADNRLLVNLGGREYGKLVASSSSSGGWIEADTLVVLASVLPSVDDQLQLKLVSRVAGAGEALADALEAAIRRRVGPAVA